MQKTLWRQLALLCYCLFFYINVSATLITFNKNLNKKVGSNKRINAVVVDRQGFLWLTSGAKLWRYDGYKLKSYSNVLNKDIKKIKKLYIDNLNNLWIGTNNNGLYKYDNSLISHYGRINNKLSSNHITAITEDNTGTLWVGTDTGLNKLATDSILHHFPISSKKDKSISSYITCILNYSKEELLVGTNKHLYLFNKFTESYKQIDLTPDDSAFIIFTIYKSGDSVWVGTEKGLYYKKNKNKFIKYLPTIISGSIPAISIDKDNVWVGSLSQGLFKISKKDNSVNNYLYDKNNRSSISNNSVTSLLSTVEGGMWVSTFGGGINYVNKKSFAFGIGNNTKGSIACSSSPSFGGLISNKEELWFITNSDLINYNNKSKKCKTYLGENQSKFQNKKIIRSAIKTANNDLWLATSLGLNKLNPETELIDDSYEEYLNEDMFFIYEIGPDQLLIGTIHGLYFFSISSHQFIALSSKKDIYSQTQFYSFVKGDNQSLYFATNNGILTLSPKNIIVSFEKVQKLLPTNDLLTLYMDHNNDLWVSTFLHGLYKFQIRKNIVHQFEKTTTVPDSANIYSIIEDDSQNIWLGTDSGLIYINDFDTYNFHENNGLQGEIFNLNAVSKADDGKLFFGGFNGFNAFYPEDIKINEIAPNIVLTDFTRFGQSIQVGQEKAGFVLEKPINELDELVLTHKDYVIGFEFSALDYADPSRNKYAYKMEGLNPDWTYVNADNRQISYSNLSPGEYTFRVKGSNKDGIWNEQGKSLKIIVKPAPWLSWWAYLLYALLGICAILWYTKRKNQANLRITTMLKNEVEKQTKELHVQKQTVETLLAKKNELFANVSHEFRTPLTLILGPINKLLNSHLPHSDIKALKMINRNANRLLTMIEQLLQIAKISDFDKIKFYTIGTKKHVKDIVDSFKESAKEKRIELKLNDNEDACIKVSTDALDIILSNLLSNAIKYTPIGGTIKVSAKLANEKFYLKVKDSGCGLDEKQQKEIFNRFKRLDSHQNIEGIGIGLSVVEELVKVNNANININSRIGEGSTFEVVFNCSDEGVNTSKANTSSLLVKQLSADANQAQGVEQPIEKIGNKRNESILIIEDNHDMRNHIADSLKHHYYCLLADRGKKGIALAIKHVPDIIICDVMMPEMDGFHVSRVLRSDGRTSHIPLMLLTALDDRESRIRGWCEHVDVYLTKPFDTQELLLQLDNILVIRNILKKKVAKTIKAGEKTSHIGLPETDKLFVDKLNLLIAKKYKNPNYLRPQMASDMAVSEKQLQRKLKALIDINPMELLREYRLKQSAIMLKGGYQVGITSDECGFNSVTYFSQCFKANYGMSPKVYQTSCNKRK